MKKTIITMILFIVPLANAETEDEIARDFVNKVYINKLTESFTTVLSLSLNLMFEEEINKDSPGNNELTEALLEHLGSEVEKESNRLNNIYAETLSGSEAFMSESTEIAKNQYGAEQLKQFNAAENLTDNAWLNIRSVKSFQQVQELANPIRREALTKAMPEVAKIIREAKENLPKSEEELMAFLTKSKSPIDVAGEAFGELMLHYMDYAMDNAEEAGQKSMSQCWTPDGKYRDPLSKIKFKGLVFQCLSLNDGEEAGYMFLPLTMVEYCTENFGSSECTEYFPSKVWVEIGDDLQK